MKKIIATLLVGLSVISYAKTLEFDSTVEFVDMTIVSDGKNNPILTFYAHVNQVDGDEKVIINLDTNKDKCYGIGKMKVDPNGVYKAWELKLTKACNGAKVSAASATIEYHDGSKETRFFKPLGDKTI